MTCREACPAAEVGPGDVESRYTKEYEEQLNPFTDFRDKERSARRRQLSPTDRVLYEVGQMITGSRSAQPAAAVNLGRRLTMQYTQCE